MIASISKVKACTLNTIKQMGAVQMELTKATDEVSDQAQVKCHTAIKSV